MTGLVQGAEADTTVAPRLSWQAKPAPASPEKAQVGVGSEPVTPGPEVMVGAAGAVRSKV